MDPARGEIDASDEAAMRAAGVKVKPPSLDELRALRSGVTTSDSLGARLAMLPAIREADVVFLGLHGGEGENGTLQALFDLAGVRYTGTGHLGSAIAMDKDLSKQLFRQNGVPTAEWVMIRAGMGEGDWGTRDDVRSLGLPVVVKPAQEGSSVGMTVVREASQMDAAIAEAFQYDDEVMVERFIAGREVTVGVLEGAEGPEALPVGEIIPKGELYDYEAKYTAGMAREVFPADLSGDETRTVQEHALRAFGALKLRGYARVDFRFGSDGTFYCLEANTLPGMTNTSLIPQAAAAAGIDFDEFCERVATLAGGSR